MGYYFDWLRSEFERNERIAIGRAEGIAIGKAEGIAIGKAEGRQEEKFDTACRLRSMGMNNDQIYTATGLSLEAISNLDKEEEE